MPPRSVWPQPPSPLQKTPLPAVIPAPLTHGVSPAAPQAPRPATRPLSYMEQLRQASTAQAAPYVEQLSKTAEPPLAADKPLREALIVLLANVLATGRDRISGRELFWRLRIPPQREKTQGRDIARVLRSLGWVRCHYGTDGSPAGRIWGWKWREWNVSAALSLEVPDDAPMPVFHAHRPPIVSIYGDDVPVHDATPEGIWAIIRYPIGPRLKIGTPRPPAKTHRWGTPPPAGNTAAN